MIESGYVKMLRLKDDLVHFKLFATIFMLGFVVGIFLANAAGKSYLSQSGILSDYYLSKYKYMEIDSAGLLLFVLQKRLKWILLLWGAGFTILGVPLVLAYSGWIGFSAGLILSVSVIRFGFVGVIFCAVGIFPQGIIYIPVLIYFAEHIYKMSQSKVHGSSPTANFKMAHSKIGTRHGNAKSLDSLRTNNKSTLSQYIGILIFVFLLFMVGVLMESYINPTLIKSFLKNI